MSGKKAKEVDPALEAQLPEHLRMEAIRQIEGAPGPGKIGASGAYLSAIRQRRAALVKLDPDLVKLGRPRVRFSREEVEEHALEKMLPRALEVIREQLESPDAKVRQQAAVKVLEYVKGKPTQTIQQELHQVSKIVYESAAWMPSHDVIDATPIFELPPAEDADSDPDAVPANEPA